MLSIKKLFAILLIATFLVSTPLALACNSSEVCSVTFVYKYDDSQGKPPGTPGKGSKDKDQDLGYVFLRKGYKWKDLPVNVVLHTALEIEYKPAIVSAMQVWDDATGATLFEYSIAIDVTADLDGPYSPDGRNELSFGDYPTEGVIAVCRVWFSPIGRKIAEFDILFDVNFGWGTDGASDVMDMWNIAAHEFGHGLGLGDIYDEEWSYLTMYGYANYGETIKRDLADGDIAGIQALYGP